MQKTPITAVENMIENIQRYNDGINDAAAALMPYARSWYALQSGDGWLFGPSKFIGYKGLTVEAYLKCEGDQFWLDGRVAERVLQQWADLVEGGDPRYHEVHLALSELCARFGRKPNTLARISIVRTGRQTVGAHPDELVALLAAVFRGLPPAQKAAFRKLTA